MSFYLYYESFSVCRQLVTLLFCLRLSSRLRLLVGNVHLSNFTFVNLGVLNGHHKFALFLTLPSQNVSCEMWIFCNRWKSSQSCSYLSVFTADTLMWLSLFSLFTSHTHAMGHRSNFHSSSALSKRNSGGISHLSHLPIIMQRCLYNLLCSVTAVWPVVLTVNLYMWLCHKFHFWLLSSISISHRILCMLFTISSWLQHGGFYNDLRFYLAYGSGREGFQKRAPTSS